MYSTCTTMCVKDQCKGFTRAILAVGMSPSCVFSKVTWRCHVFRNVYIVFANDVTKCVCVLMIDICIKCSENNMSGFLGGILCTSSYACIFVCIVV